MEAPRSILLQIDNTARTVQRIWLACQLAEAFSADVTAQPCMLPGMTRFPATWEGASAAAEFMLAYDKECLDQAHATFVRECTGSNRLHWAEPLPEGPHGFAARALYADLMLLGQRDSSDPAAGELPPDFLSDVLVRSGRPALILPYTGQFDPLGGKVLIAWKETREAARAVTAALPWLRQASHVHVACWGTGSANALSLLESQLSSHGIRIVPHAGRPEPEDVGNLLLSMAADVDADLLVMGGYGHSRAREWVMGGATRTVLQTMTLPVLMSH